MFENFNLAEFLDTLKGYVEQFFAIINEIIDQAKAIGDKKDVA